MLIAAFKRGRKLKQLSFSLGYLNNKTIREYCLKNKLCFQLHLNQHYHRSTDAKEALQGEKYAESRSRRGRIITLNQQKCSPNDEKLKKMKKDDLIEFIERKLSTEPIELNEALLVLKHLSKDLSFYSWSHSLNKKNKTVEWDSKTHKAAAASFDAVLRNSERLPQAGLYQALTAVAKLGHFMKDTHSQRSRLVQVAVGRLCNNLASDSLPPFSISYTATVLASLLKQGYSHKVLSRFMNQVPRLASSQIHNFKDRDIAMLVQSLTDFHQSIPLELVEPLTERYIQIGKNFSLQSVASLLQSLINAKQQPNPALLTLVGDALVSRIPAVPEGDPIPTRLRQVTPNDLQISFILYNFSRLKCRHARVFRQFEKRLMLLESSPKNCDAIGKFLGSVATLNLLSDDFFQFAVDILSAHLDSLPSTLISTLCWVSSKHGVKDQAFYRRITEVSLKDFDSYNVYALTTIANSMKYCNVDCPEFMTRAGQSIILKVSKLSPERLVHVLWSFSGKERGKQRWCAELIQEIEDKITEDMPRLSPHMLSRLALSFASLDWRPDKLFPHLSQQVQEDIESYGGRDLIQLAYSWGCLGIQDHKLFKAISNQARLQELRKWGFSHLGNFAWGMSIYGDLEPDLLLHLLKEINRFGVDQGFISRVQWHQAIVNARLQFPDYAPIQAHQPHAELSREEIVLHARKGTTSSRFHKSVFTILTDLGLPCQNEYITSLGYSIDIKLISQKSQKIGIEVDGPSHFAVNTTDFLGRTVMKHRNLRQAGWKLISVPYHKWTNLSYTQKREYLENKFLTLRMESCMELLNSM